MISQSDGKGADEVRLEGHTAARPPAPRCVRGLPRMDIDASQRARAVLCALYLVESQEGICRLENTSGSGSRKGKPFLINT